MTNEIDPPLTGTSWGVHFPLFLLSLALAIYLAAQIAATQQGGKTMRWQRSNIDKQIEGVKAAEKQADELNTRAEEPVKQANQLQERFSALLNDVYDLSKDDDDAKQVVQHWKIQRNQKEGSGDAKAEPAPKP